METLYRRLAAYANSDYYGFHMPGHKRNDHILGNELPYKIDITEIEGFDDLHHAKGILKDMQDRASEVYCAEETHYLINGSTVGIMSAVLGCTHKGERILIARNCHKSVYAAVYMNELEPVYVYPQYDSETGLNGAVKPDEIRAILSADKVLYEKAALKDNISPGQSEDNVSAREQGFIRAVVITSPTYDGVVSDVKQIAEVVHEFGIPLIVDEAHGAHFGFHPYFPKNANQQGADAVIHSLHKTLPSLTQTALLHINGKLADRSRIKRYLDILQTSSPSYILMSSIEECIEFLEKGSERFQTYQNNLCKLRTELKELKCLHLIETENYDDSKIVISTRGTGYTGKELYQELLENYHLQMEMASREYVLAMTSICDTQEGFRRLKQALFEIDGNLDHMKKNGRNAEACKIDISMELPHLKMICTSAQVDAQIMRNRESEFLILERCEGKVALEYAYVYPPGIPIIVPGEQISKEAIRCLQFYMEAGFDIEGLEKEGKVKVWLNG